MIDEEQDLEIRRKIADLRFAAIAPLVQNLISGSKAEYARDISKHPFTMPGSRERYYSPKTILRWYSDYMAGGMDALMPRTRGDRGASRVLSDDAVSEIQKLRKQFPRMKAPMIRDRLIAEQLISEEVSLSTIQRFIRNNPTEAGSESGSPQRERRAFEMERPNLLWQADTAYFPPVTIDGRSARTYLMVILDDYSRLITGAGLFLRDNALNFQCVLKDAIQTYGIPARLMTDNGAPHSNEQLTYICGDLGIVHIRNKPRDPAAKGKVERVIETLRTRFLSGFDPSSVHSLDEYREEVRSWIRTYNAAKHSAVGTAPKDRFLSQAENLRRPLSEKWLDECFLNRAVRCVRRDSTFVLNGTMYDAPMQFAGQKAEIRFSADDPDNVWIVLGPERFQVFPTDKVANGKAKRRNESQPAVNYALEAQNDD